MRNYHSAKHERDNVEYPNPNCHAAQNIQRRCVCQRRRPIQLCEVY